MKLITRYTLLTAGIAALAVTIMSFADDEKQERGEWIAPLSTDTIKNPLKGNISAAAKGEELYRKYCKVCHGLQGQGNGLAVPELPVKPADLSSRKVQKQSDGMIFWKLSTGRAPMAAYEQALNREQRWQLVNYIRNLKAF